MVLSGLSSFSANANPYNWKVLRVLDGDTVEVEAKFLPPELKPVLHLRVLGVDTPEKGRLAKCHIEESMSLRAKLFTEQTISNAKVVQIEIKDWDKYGGRILGDVLVDGKRLSELLIEKQYAKPYTGKGDKFNWCGQKRWYQFLLEEK